MAERQFDGPTPRMVQSAAMLTAALNMARTALKWRELVERRGAGLIELYRSGRWKLYYTHEEFLLELSAADAMARRWATIAPTPEERLADPRQNAA